MDLVCLKEGLVAILEKVLGMANNEADNPCRQTESSSFLKLMEIAKKLCNQITHKPLCAPTEDFNDAFVKAHVLLHFGETGW